MADKAAYTKFLYGGSERYKGCDMYILKVTRKSTEERALKQIAPLSKLNPGYANPRVSWKSSRTEKGTSKFISY
jgi:hypothetical protein